MNLTWADPAPGARGMRILLRTTNMRGLRGLSHYRHYQHNVDTL